MTPPLAAPPELSHHELVIGLNAVIVGVTDRSPRVLVVRGAGAAPALPFGPFDPEGHRTFEIGLRSWVSEQTGFELGYVEQLYTFADQGRDAPLAALAGAEEARVISIGYLALTPNMTERPPMGAAWEDWERFFPWEDWREKRPEVIGAIIDPALRAWADEAGPRARRAARWDRARLLFGLEGASWNEERVLDRYELLYEAGLVPEAAADRARADGKAIPAVAPIEGLGEPMASDHRRIIATAVGRLRGKLKYRPIVFELMPPEFRLYELQRAVEAIMGLSLHKQNFRRALAASDLIARTGRFDHATGGRPAELFRFNREASRERAVLGVPVPRLTPS